MSFFIQDAFAASTTTGAADGGGMGSIIMLVAFIGLFYFLLWLPQSKRVKEHKQLVTGLAVGDEVISSGGILGKITKIEDDFITLQIASNVEILVQKGAVSATVPKGSLKSVN